MKKILTLVSMMMIGFSAPTFAQLPDLDMSNAKQAVSNMITGGQPSKDDLAKFKERGVKTVVSLRGAGENPGFDEAAEVEKLGMKFVNIPVSSAGDLTVDNAKALSMVLAESGGDAVVHCASGNRVGALMAVKAYALDGKDKGQAIKEGQQFGLTSMASTVNQVLDGMPQAMDMMKKVKKMKMPKLPKN